MHKVLFWIRNITTLIVVILMIMSYSGLSMIGITNLDYHFWTTFILMIVFIQQIVLGIRHSKLNEDNHYSLLLIVANMIFIMLYLRTMFDMSIVTTYLGVHSNELMGERYMFLDYNLPWVAFIYGVLFLYPSTYLKRKLKKNEK